MILYKYMSLAGALQVLANNTLGFSRASFLNDPFDTPIALPVPTANPAEAMFAGVAAWGKSMIWELHTAFLSLTRTPTNALMWAHYADHHRGVVLAIDTNAAGLLSPERNLIPAHFGNVVYARHRPSGPYHSTVTEAVVVGATHHFVLSHYEKWQRLFLTKPIEWSYEEEVRVAKSIHGLKAGTSSNASGDFTVVTHMDRPLHCYHLAGGSISAIYAGARMSKANLEALKKAAAGVSVQTVEIDQLSYQISIPAIG